MLKILVFTFFLSFPLSAQDIDSAKANDKTKSFHNLNAVSPSVRENYTNNKDALKVGCAVVGFFIGFVGGGYIVEETVIIITGNDEIHMWQLGALIGGIAGGYVGVKIVDNLYGTDEEISLQITPIYDIAQNGAGLGVSLNF